MLKEIRNALAPSTKGAQETLDIRSQELVAAQAQLDSAMSELDAAHEANEDLKKLTMAEAAVVAAHGSLARAEKAYRAADKRLTQATDQANEAGREAAHKSIQTAIAARLAVGKQIDAIAEQLAGLMVEVKKQDVIIGMALPVVGGTKHFTANAGERAIAAALSRTGAMRKRAADVTIAPTAVDVMAAGHADLLTL